MKYTIIALFLSVTNLYAITVYYKIDTGEIVEVGDIVKSSLDDDSAYSKIQVNENVLRLKKYNEQRVNHNKKKLENKSQEQITFELKVKRMIEIRQEIRKRKQKISEYMLDKSEGFDVSTETTTLRNEIDVFKVEYQSLQ